MLKLATPPDSNDVLLPKLLVWNADDPDVAMGFNGGGLLNILLISFGLPLGIIFNFFAGGSPPGSGPDTMTDVGTQDCCCMCLLGMFSWLSLFATETDTGLEFETLIVTTVLCAAVGAATVYTGCVAIGWLWPWMETA